MVIKSFSLVSLLTLLSTSAANAWNVPSKPAPFPFSKFDTGCSVSIHRTWPNVAYDARTGDRIVYDVSRCTGGYIRGENSGRSWHVKIDDHLDFSGVDLNGSRWKYDRASGRYINLTLGRSCESSDLRVVCPLPS